MMNFINNKLIMGSFTIMTFVTSHAADDHLTFNQRLEEETGLHLILNALHVIRDGGEVPFTLKFNKSKTLVVPRDYKVTMNEAEKENLHYILNALGNNSMFSIGCKKGYIEFAGSCIDHIHPLQILIEMLNDPVNNLNLQKIYHRPMIWNALFLDYADTLAEENNSKNVMSHIDDFSNQLNIEPRYILSSVKKANWMEFFDLLLAQVGPSSVNFLYLPLALSLLTDIIISRKNKYIKFLNLNIKCVFIHYLYVFSQHQLWTKMHIERIRHT